MTRESTRAAIARELLKDHLEGDRQAAAPKERRRIIWHQRKIKSQSRRQQLHLHRHHKSRQ